MTIKGLLCKLNYFMQLRVFSEFSLYCALWFLDRWLRRQLASAKTEELQATEDLSETKNENKRFITVCLIAQCKYMFSVSFHIFFYMCYVVSE